MYEGSIAIPPSGINTIPKKSLFFEKDASGSKKVFTDSLSSTSQKDQNWDLKRGWAQDIERIFRDDDEFFPWADKLHECSTWLDFGQFADTGTGEISLKLKRTNFCRNRHCPVCQWRRSLTWKGRMMTQLPHLFAAHPAARFLFLTLTVPNPEIGDLRETLKAMNASFLRLLRRKELKHVKGWIRATEVTVGETGPLRCHPHFHILLMVSSSYFKKGAYISQARWTELWEEAAKLDSKPIVDVRAVKGSDDKDMAKAIAETLKYSTKATDAISEPSWFLEYCKQVKGMRFIGSGGVLKDALREDVDESEMINTDVAEADTLIDTEDDVMFRWYRQQRRYFR